MRGEGMNKNIQKSLKKSTSKPKPKTSKKYNKPLSLHLLGMERVLGIVLKVRESSI